MEFIDFQSVEKIQTITGEHGISEIILPLRRRGKKIQYFEYWILHKFALLIYRKHGTRHLKESIRMYFARSCGTHSFPWGTVLLLGKVLKMSGSKPLNVNSGVVFSSFNISKQFYYDSVISTSQLWKTSTFLPFLSFLTLLFLQHCKDDSITDTITIKVNFPSHTPLTFMPLSFSTLSRWINHMSVFKYPNSKISWQALPFFPDATFPLGI